MIGCPNHDAGCSKCHGTGLVTDHYACSEDGPERVPCEQCQYTVYEGSRIAWWGEAEGIVDALDRARNANPELRHIDLAATSPCGRWL